MPTRWPCAGRYCVAVILADPASPLGAVSSVGAVALEVIGESLKLQDSHPTAPPLNVLGLVLRGRRAQPISFGDVSSVSQFGLLVVEAFGRSMPVSDWVGF